MTIDTEPPLVQRDNEGIVGPPGWAEWMAFFGDSEGNLVGVTSRHPPPS